MGLFAEQFFSDPDVKASIDTIIQKLKHLQTKINSVQSASVDQAQSFQQLIDNLAQSRAKLVFPYLSSGIGNGALVELADGSVKYDLINGIGVHFSHSDPALIETALYAALKDTVMQGNLQQDACVVPLYNLLTESSGLGLAYLTSSGAMAVENALKIAFQKRFPATRVLAFENCFCGRTLAAASITDKAKYRDGLPISLDVDYIPFYDAARPEESTAQAVAALKRHIQRFPSQHACMILELVQGEGGFNVGTKAFFEAIMTELKAHDILVIVDEIQTFGRTPELFAFHYFELQDYVDMVTIGKVAQVCATLLKKDLQPKAGLISQTFTSSTTAIECSKTIINTLLSGNYYGDSGHIQTIHNYVKSKFLALQEKYPDVLDGFSGLGTMIAFVPFKGNREKVIDFVHKLYANGLITFIAGQDIVKLRFLLPLGALNTGIIDAVFSILDDTIEQSIKGG